MERKMELTYGSQECEEILSIVLDIGLTSAHIETAAGEPVATMVHSTHMLFLQNGIAEGIEPGDKLYLVFNRIKVMGHLSALARLANILFNSAQLNVNHKQE